VVTRTPKPVVSDFYVHLTFNVNQTQSVNIPSSKTGFQLQELLMPDFFSVSEDEAEGEKSQRSRNK